MGGRRLRQAAADDGAAVHHRLHHRQSRLAQPAELRTLGLRTAAVIAGLWLVALTFAFLIPLTFPSIQSASFFSSSLVERRPAFDFVALYVPSNPFNALANNIVPAVVLFSIVLGIALVGVEDRERLLDVLDVAQGGDLARDALRDAPDAVRPVRDRRQRGGHARSEQLGRLQIYLVAYVLVALLVEPVGAARPGRRADADSRRATFLRESQGLAADRGDRRRSVHRAAGAHAGQPHDCSIGSIPASAEPAHGGASCRHRSTFRTPASCCPSASSCSPAGSPMRRCRSRPIRSWRSRAGQFLRQPDRGGAVPARPVPHSGGHLPAVPRDRRHQLARRLAGRGGPHGHGGAARDVRDHRTPALEARATAALRGITLALVIA